jgi:pilus assembly protein CpaE
MSSSATSSPRLSVLLITRDPEVKLVGPALQADGIATRAVATPRELQRALTAAKSRCVAVLDGELSADPTLPLANLLQRLKDVPLLVLMPAESDPATVRDPQRTTIEEYARKPIAPSVLALRIKALILAAGMALPPPVAATGLPAGLELPEDGRGQLTVVFSVKGGSGKSTVAVNLAVGLASIYHVPTLLADADLWFGDVGVLLNLAGPRSSYDVCASEEADLFALPKAVTPHASGAAVLLRPADPLSVEKLRIRSFVDALDRYRSLYDHVIVDTQSSLDELNLDLLEAATRILLVVTPEMGAIHNTARFLVLAERLRVSEKLVLILNRANSGISTDQLQRTLGLPIKYGIVSAGRMMIEAVNEGTSLFTMDPGRRERITQDLAAIVELIAGRDQPPIQREPHRGLPLRLLRRSA